MRQSWRPVRSSDARSGGLVFVALLHVAAIALLLHVGGIRQVVAEARPLFVLLLPSTPAAEPQPPPATPPPAPNRPRQLTAVKTVPPMQRPTLPAPSPAIESPIAVEAAPAAVAEAAPTTAVAAVPSTPAPAPAAAPQPAPPPTISVVQYLRAPQIDYPAASRRMREEGRVVVHVLIDETGRVIRVELAETSPYPRLNAAALKAAREALYRPYAVGGSPTAAWAVVPIVFALRSQTVSQQLVERSPASATP